MTEAEYRQSERERESRTNELLGRAFAIITDPACFKYGRAKWIEDYQALYSPVSTADARREAAEQEA